MLPASAFSKDENQSIEIGGNDFLPKPIHFDSLLTKVEKHLNINGSSGFEGINV